MASASQSLRFLGPATAGPGGGTFDAVNRILTDLCNRGNPKVIPNSLFLLPFFFLMFGCWENRNRVRETGNECGLSFLGCVFGFAGRGCVGFKKAFGGGST